MQIIKVLFGLFFASLVVNTIGSVHTNNDRIECYSNNNECGNGYCCIGYFNTSVGFCNCNSRYVNIDTGVTIIPCDYKQKSKLKAFLLSFFVGGFGTDWFYLADNNRGYIAAGVFKLLTLGGFLVWWLVDWIRILADDFPDGNAVALSD